MEAMKACQIILLLFAVSIFFQSLRIDFYGVKAKEPYGFSGAIATVILASLFFLLFWKAGAFSTLLR